VFGEGKPINRVKIRRFKKELKKEWQDGSLVIDDFPAPSIDK
jgi:hypothetical protein